MSEPKQNPKHIQAMKDGKAPLEYLVTSVFEGDAYVHKGGGDKYGKRNWTIDEILASTYVAAMMRHLKAWTEGEDLDPDSGWNHLYHLRACCAVVLDGDKHGKLIDDRLFAESKSAEQEKSYVTMADYNDWADNDSINIRELHGASARREHTTNPQKE